MARTADTRTLLIDPTAPRRAPRERLTMRWHTRTAPDGTRTLVARWSTVSDAPAAALAAAA